MGRKIRKYFILKGVLQTDHPLVIQEASKLRIAAPLVYCADRKKLGMISENIRCERRELAGPVIQVLCPAEGQVEAVVDVGPVVLE